MAQEDHDEVAPQVEADDSTDAMDEFVRYGLCPLLGSPDYARWLACDGSRCRREDLVPPYIGCKKASNIRKAHRWPSYEVDP